MAKSGSFSYTNTSVGTNTLTPYKLGLTSNYAVTADSADRAVLSNKTAPIDAEEIISFRSASMPRVDSDLNIQYPSPVNNAIRYNVQLQEVYSITDSETDFRVDEPIVMDLTVKHHKSGYITGSVIGEVFLRLGSALIKENGTYRFDDLMRSAERPTID